MGRILVAEADSVLAAVLEDRLRTAGHWVDVVGDGGRALETLDRDQVDLVLLDLALPPTSGVEMVRAIRQQPDSVAVPILALSDPLDGPKRVEILRAGADEIIVRPIDLEELLLRVERLCRSGAHDPVLLEGKLGSQPLWEVVQILEESRREGRVLVWNRWGSGRVRLAEGRVVAADWERLSGTEALLAMLGQLDGRFRFIVGSEAPGKGDADAGPIDTRRALLETAWIRDELERRREHAPPTGGTLGLLRDEVPDPGPDLPKLPLEWIVDRVRSRPGSRAFDLLIASPVAPQRLRLALAWLCERGVLEVADAEPTGEGAVSTLALAETEVLEAALIDLVDAARERGFRSSTLPLLLLSEEGCAAEARALFEKWAGRWRPEVLGGFLEQLSTRGGGTCVIPTEAGELALHFQILSPGSEAKVVAIAPVCAGVVVWLDRLEQRGPFARLVERYDRTAEAGVGVAVATRSESSAAIAAVLHGHDRWRWVPEAPRNLLAVFRLLRGGPAAVGPV